MKHLQSSSKLQLRSGFKMTNGLIGPAGYLLSSWLNWKDTCRLHLSKCKKRQLPDLR